MTICPLCNFRTFEFSKDKDREYFKCKECGLISVPEKYHLSTVEEKKRYDLHTNNPEDIGYRNFLKRIFIPMKERIAPGSSGLDFGSGPGPTLSKMFEEAGFKMKIYDLFYADDKSGLKDKYDFITTTEVAEHLKNPLRELDMLWGCLKQGGTLGIMTKFSPDKEKFSKWHYINDETHISFFSKQTFEWLKMRWDAKLEILGNDIAIFKKIN